MAKPQPLINTLTGGFCSQNPILKLALGLCPSLAVTTSLINGFAMGAAATFVLVMSSFIVSSLRRFIPASTRLPILIVIIATFVTIVQMFMAAKLPDLNKVLGIFLPLIVVNCIILGRAEAFARKNSIAQSVADALGMGFGFIWILTAIGGIRELIGSGKLLGATIFPEQYAIKIFAQPAGGFLIMGISIGIFMIWLAKQKKKENEIAKKAFIEAKKELSV